MQNVTNLGTALSGNVVLSHFLPMFKQLSMAIVIVLRIMTEMQIA